MCLKTSLIKAYCFNNISNNNNNNNNNKQEFVYRDATNVEPEMYDCTSNNWSHWNSNEKLKQKFWKLYQENIR